MRIQLKTNQEPFIVSLQRAVQELKPREVVSVNTPVGESESNGRVENAIRRVQEKTRVPRRQLEQNMNVKLPDSSPVMPWMVRWAAALLSKYSRGDDGKSAYERLHGEKCVTPLVPFGESILYLPMRIVRKGQRRSGKIARSMAGCDHKNTRNADWDNTRYHQTQNCHTHGGPGEIGC